jgi:hypothetical protein
VLRSILDLENLKVSTFDEGRCGRTKDVYFNDQAWKISHLIVAIEPWQRGQKQILVQPDQLEPLGSGETFLRLKESVADFESFPLAGTVLPVCKQYDLFALGSPGASSHRRVLNSDPSLRSVRAVRNYNISVFGQFGGTLADFIFDDVTWEIRYLKIEQRIDRKKLLFYVLPQAVERFTWATQKLVLRNLQPVALDSNELPGTEAAA